MANRKTYALDQSPLYKLSSRKRLAQDVFNVDLPFLERLAANEGNFWAAAGSVDTDLSF